MVKFSEVVLNSEFLLSIFRIYAFLICSFQFSKDFYKAKVCLLSTKLVT